MKLVACQLTFVEGFCRNEVPNQFYDAPLRSIIGSLRWDDGYAQERQAEVKHKNARLPSVFIHPSNLGGNCKTTLVSSHRKRSLLFLYFPVGNLVCQLFARFISRIPFLYYAVHFLASFCQKFPKQNVNAVNRLSNSSFFVVVMFPPKTSVPCARARNDRNWREKRSTRSSLPAVMSTVVEQALVLS